MSSFIRVWGIALIIISSCWNLVGQGVIYVDQKANGNMDGSSWQDAYTDLRPAIEAAVPGDAIWVAEGVYRPGDTLQSRYVIDKDIRLLGGFSGTEDLEADRNPEVYETILSGDVFQNDLPGDLQTNRQDNLFTILEIGLSATQDALVDGFTFRGGHARGDNTFLTNAWGGAIFCSGAPIIRACRFEDQFAKDRGAAIYIQSNEANNMLIEQCVFVGNESDQDGGAIFINQVNMEGVVISECMFDLNKAERRGGAIALYNASSRIEKCQFNGNGARQTGGAVQVQASYNQLTNVLDSCSFSQNEATRGGAVSLVSSSVFGAVGNTFEVTRCHFNLNESNDFTNNPNDDIRGGAIYLESNVNASETSALIADCTFTNNQTAGEGGVAHVQFDGQESRLRFVRNSAVLNSSTGDGPLTIFSKELGEAEIIIDSCLFEANHALEGSAGIFIEATQHSLLDVRLTNSSIQDATANATSGFTLRSADQAKVTCSVLDCSWTGNAGQAIVVIDDGNDLMDVHWQNVRLEDNGIFGSSAIMLAGAGSEQPDEPRFRFENLLMHHQAGGEVIWQMDQVKAKVQNMTCAENEMPAFRVGNLATLVLQNTILANAGEWELEDIHPDGAVISLGGNVIDDETFQGWLIPADQIAADIGFASLNTFFLSPGSPAIDVGTLPDTLFPLDLAGQDRIQGLAIDAGALESPFTSALGDVEASPIALRMFPNPATDWIRIQVPDRWDQVDRMVITDMEGRLLSSLSLRQDSALLRVEVKDMMPGQYLVWLSDPEGRQAVGLLFVSER